MTEDTSLGLLGIVLDAMHPSMAHASRPTILYQARLVAKLAKIR